MGLFRWVISIFEFCVISLTKWFPQPCLAQKVKLFMNEKDLTSSLALSSNGALGVPSSYRGEDLSVSLLYWHFGDRKRVLSPKVGWSLLEMRGISSHRSIERASGCTGKRGVHPSLSSSAGCRSKEAPKLKQVRVEHAYTTWQCRRLTLSSLAF